MYVLVRTTDETGNDLDRLDGIMTLKVVIYRVNKTGVAMSNNPLVKRPVFGREKVPCFSDILTSKQWPGVLGFTAFYSFEEV